MKPLLLVLAVLAMTHGVLHAQHLRWAYASAEGSDCNRVALGLHGEVCAAGHSYRSSTVSDFLVISLDSSGRKRWSYSRNGQSNLWDEARSVVCGPGGDVYAAGYLYGADRTGDFTVVCLDSTGTERWVYSHYAPALHEFAQTVLLGRRGNLYVSGGWEQGDSHGLLVVCLDSAGGERWVYRDTLGFTPVNMDDPMAITPTGQIYVASMCFDTSITFSDMLIISLDSTGNERWVRRYHGPGNLADEAWAVACGADGHVYVCGTATRSDSMQVASIVSFDSAGNQCWVYNHDFSSGLYALAIGPDTNLYATGYVLGVVPDIVVLSVNTTGAERWVRSYNGPGNNTDLGNSVACSNDGRVYAVGPSYGDGTGSDIAVLCLDTAGNMVWTFRYGDALYDDANSVVCDDRDFIYFGGHTADTELVVVSMSSATGIPAASQPATYGPHLQTSVIRGVLLLGAFSNQQSAFRAELLDISGRKVLDLQPGANDVSRLSTGVYFVREAQARAVRKVIVQR